MSVLGVLGTAAIALVAIVLPLVATAGSVVAAAWALGLLCEEPQVSSQTPEE